MEKPKREFQEIREEGSYCLGRLIYDAEEMDAFLEEQAVKQREWARAMEIEVQEIIFELKGFYHHHYHKDWETANARLQELEKQLNQITKEKEAMV